MEHAVATADVGEVAGARGHHRDVGAVLGVDLQGRRVVHAVDLLAGHHDHRLFGRAIEEIEVLEQGVGLPGVGGTVFGDGRGDGSDELAEVEIGGSGSSVGTGGAVTKVSAAKVANDAGVAVLLTSSDLVNDALAGDNIGTWFEAKG